MYFNEVFRTLRELTHKLAEELAGIYIYIKNLYA